MASNERESMKVINRGGGGNLSSSMIAVSRVYDGIDVKILQPKALSL